MKGPELVKHILVDLLAKGKLDEALEYFDDSFLCKEAMSLPYAGEYRGKAGFLKLFGLLSSTWDEFGFTIHDTFGNDENVAVVETIFGKVGAEPFKMPVIEYWQLRNGKVIDATPYYHDTALLEKLFAKRAAKTQAAQ